MLRMLLLLTALFAFSVCAPNFLDKNQQFQSYVEKAKILDYTSNDEAWENLREKWENKQNLKIRVLGDSHVAGDFLTQELRVILGNANSIGFTYPLMPPYHQNVLLSYDYENFDILDSRKKIEGYNPDYPLGGVIAVANEGLASLKLDIKENLLNIGDKGFTTHIVFSGQPKKGAFVVEDSKGVSLTLTPSSNKWEIANHYLSFPISIRALHQGAKLGGYFIYKDQNPLLIEHLGVNGVRSDIWLKWDLRALRNELRLLEYDLIVLFYGSNDATLDNINEEKFIENYSRLIEILRDHNPQALILLVSPPPVLLTTQKEIRRATGVRHIKVIQQAPGFEAVRKALRTLAKREGTLLFDASDFISDTGSKDSWVKDNLSKEDVHLSPSGYKLIAHALHRGLQNLILQKSLISSNLDSKSGTKTSHLDPLQKPLVSE